jgi:arylsulfatase
VACARSKPSRHCRDTRTGVALIEYRYDVPFKFSGRINKLTFKLEPEAKR